MHEDEAGRAGGSAEVALRETRAWVAHAVIGLNLCPFAKAPSNRDRIRYVVSDATAPDALLSELDDELHFLVSHDEAQVETTLVVHPRVLTDFLDFNDFLGVGEALIAERRLEGVVQLASFHPQYQFAGTDVDDPANATNRSPYPTLHLLRESSIERAVAAFPDTDTIFEANIATLQRLGADGWAALQARCRADALDAGDA